MLNGKKSRTLVLSALCLSAALALSRPARSADKAVNLDGVGTAESTVSTNVVTTYPVKIKNKITNRAVGKAYSFRWPSAGPGGFTGNAGTATKPGTTAGVGAIWTWETTQQVFTFTGSQCANDICFTQTFPTGSTAQIGAFGVPGRSLTSSGVTVTNESLTASLLSFFSPEVELFHVTSSVEQLASGLFRYKTVLTNSATEDIVVNQPPLPIGCNSLCGDGVAQGIEPCDGLDLRGSSCDSFGQTGPGLACTDQCTIDLSACVPAECGNSFREGYEVCDGEDLNGSTCEDLGGTGGTLSCQPDCAGFDEGNCEGICGNSVQEGSELCDGTDLGGESCASQGGSGSSPTIEFSSFEYWDACSGGKCPIETNGTTVTASNEFGEHVLRPASATGGEAGSAWYGIQQPVAQGFSTSFRFRISGPSYPDAADGLAFVIQSSSLSALGGTGQNQGYGGIPHSLAVEFDIYQNGAPVYDPNANHVAVQSCGAAANTEEHPPSSGSCTIGSVNAAPGVTLADGQIHTVTIRYLPPPTGTLLVYLDNTETPVLSVAVDLATLGLGGEGLDSAYVGFTAATGAAYANHDILDWTFTPGAGGTLTCTNACSLDLSQCTDLCGNGVREGGEECDGSDLDGANCSEHGGGGAVSCDSSCHLDYSDCTEFYCGNDVIDTKGEQCDGPSLGEATCIDFGASGGELGCAATCEYDLSGCTDYCGNGVVDEGEECDGSNLDGWDCLGPGSGESGSVSSPGPNRLDGSIALRTSPRTARPGGRLSTVLAPLAVEGGSALACDFECHFDRSACDVPCTTPGSSYTIPGNSASETCEVVIHPAKEVTGEVVVCPEGSPEGDPLCGGADPISQGTANRLVPDESVTITGPYLVTSGIEVVDGGNNLAEPGETVQVFVHLYNAGPVGLTGVHVTLSSVPEDVDGDGTPDDITIVQGESDYPDGACMNGLPGVSGDCNSPEGTIPSCVNVTPFVITLPPGHPVDVSRTLNLSITGTPVPPIAELGRTFGSTTSILNTRVIIGVGGPVCGDGFLQPGEECDYGDVIDGDCCSSLCLLETGDCSDGNVCTLDDTCNSGLCASGGLNSCDDGNPCTDDACNPTAPADGCTHSNNTNSCDSGQGLCSGGVCVPVPRACPVAIVEADTMVKKSSSTSNYGKKTELEANNPTSDVHTLVRIRLAGTTGHTIQHAALKLFAESSSSSGGRIHEAACNWTETGVTWRTKPSFTATPIDVKGSIVKNRPVTFDLSSALQGDGDGTYCFLIDNVLGDAEYFSRESTVGRPSVTLDTALSCVPVATEVKADATVVSTTPSTNFGASPVLGVDASPIKQTFFRLAVTGVGSRTVTSARLRLMIASISGSDADKGGSIKLVPSTQCGGWGESTITYANRPPVTGSTLSSVSAVKAGQLVEFDLKTTIPGDGTYCYRLDSSSTNGADYNSKEGAILRPELVLTVAP